MKAIIQTNDQALHQALEAFETELDRLGGPETPLDLFYTAFAEALQNAAEHGNSQIETKMIGITTLVGPGFAFACICDQGRGFFYHPANPKEVKGTRGRGLAMIAMGVDSLYHNDRGNLIAFWKSFDSRKPMKLEMDNAYIHADILSPGVMLVREVEMKFMGILNHALTELLEERIDQFGLRMVILNCEGLRSLSSMCWGVVIQFLKRNETESFVLYNANDAILKTARMLGLTERQGISEKLTILAEQPQTLEAI